VAAMPFFIGGCEDGPNQTFSPAPPNAGSVWNGPPGQGGLADGGAFVATASQSYDASVGGQNANDLCTATQEKAIWANLFTEPVQPPGLAGGLDLAGGPMANGASGYQGPNIPFTYDITKESWTGNTVEQAEKILCQAVATVTFSGTTPQIGWGENYEMNAGYNSNTRALFDLILTYGYNGTLSATDKSGTNYSIGLQNTPIMVTTKGGQPTPLLLNWTDSGFNKIVNSIYLALLNTYGGSYPPPPSGKTCVDTGDCEVGNFQINGGAMYFVPMGLLVYVPTTVGSEQANSTVNIIQIVLEKLLPFSKGATLMKLDAEGPTATTTNVQQVPAGASGGTTCVYKLGMTYKDFDAQCVQVQTAQTDTNPPPNDYKTVNIVNENKLLGGMTHDNETYQFAVVGLDPQFAASPDNLPATTIVADGQKPTGDDVAFEFVIDQQYLGPVANDYTYDDVTQAQDLHGLGMITLEWANMVQHYMQKAYGVTTELGEPACLAPNTPAMPAAAQVGPLAPGVKAGTPVKCSGLEGIMTTAPATTPDGKTNLLTFPQQKANALGVSATLAGPVIGTSPVGSSLSLGMRTGTWYSIFCNDATGNWTTGYTDCIGGAGNQFQGTASFYFDTMLDAVLQSQNFGTVLSQMPQRDLGNRRFYFQQWMLAVVKYLQAVPTASAAMANPNLAYPTLAQIDSEPVDLNELFFDTNGSGFENGVYVLRSFVNSDMQPPTEFEVVAELNTGGIANFLFGRHNFRGENLAYTALTTTPGDLPGAENLFLSNMVGSPVLQSAFSSYACAIEIKPGNASCGNKVGPVDALGNPLLTGYQPAFGQSIFHIAANGQSPTPAPFTLDTQGPQAAPYTLLQSAQLTVPIWSNPYDPTTATPNDKKISALLPYVPKGAGIGFPVTIDGSRDKFYNTDQIDFSGETLSALMDFEQIGFTGADGGATPGYVVRAIESGNYLGLAFACNETGANGSPDILAVRMYDNATTILDYLAKYPTATNDCQIQIKYSIYGNYADYISTLNNGARFSLNAGFGGSVVADLTLFDPNVVATLGQ
jgi:hypothetical protein